jgi:lipid-A-disaccharide synthase
MERTFMFIAGEASGDTLGCELAKALRRAPGGENFHFFGAGGPKLAEAGVEPVLDLASHAVVGVWEVLKNYGKFKGFFDELLNLAIARKPEFIILIDYPGFNLRFAKAIRERFAASNWRPKIVYYVSPQIWAWHGSRVHQIARDIDLLLAIFPFEKEWYAKRKPEFHVEFVGHPLIDRYAQASPPKAEEGSRKLLLLPGSRVRELRKHLPVMLAAARKIESEMAISLEIVVPSEKLERLARSLGDLDGISVRIGGLAEALMRATAAIASSGTVTMECAYFGVPTVVLYKTSWSTYFLGRQFIQVKYLAMPNLLANEPIYPELIQSEASPENLYRSTKCLMESPETRAEVKAKLRQVIASLGEAGASERAAKAILGLSDSATQTKAQPSA